MGVIYYYGDNETIKNDLKSIVSEKHIFTDFVSFSSLEDNSIIVIDFYELKNKKWKKNWPN